MDISLLPKGFFRKNPLDEMSAARIADVSIEMESNDEIHEKMRELLYEDFPPERIAALDKEAETIAALDSPEAIVSYMRKDGEPLNRPALCRKALAVEPEIMPLILRRYRTSQLTTFIETAVRVFAMADRIYTEQLFQDYENIRDSYAQSMACFLFGRQKLENSVPLLLREYERMREEFPDDDLAQGPLLGLSILYGKA